MAKRQGSFKDFTMRKAREATRNAMVELADSTVRTLQLHGPYWDGYFANAWEVKLGNVDIPATTPGQPGSPDGSSELVFTAPIIPPPDLRKGYTIGNSMEYRAIAMDLVPDATGAYRYERLRSTADQDWYTNLVEGGELLRLNKTAVDSEFFKAFR